ncbi:MAG: CPBP family intramembrane metalloprotease [Actinobacteria bacterium]|nr:MAG: CPBP family intramembrane metalloprotease [Actinomycetota bacterium]
MSVTAREELWRPSRWRAGPLGPKLAASHLWAVVVVGVVYNIVSNLFLPGAAYVPANLALASGLVWYATRAGVEMEDLGLAHSQVGRGMRLGGVVFVVVGLAITAAAVIPGTRDAFVDDRVSDASLLAMLYHVLVRIPLGTALFEEVLFRVVLLAFLLRRFTVWSAVSVSSALFGLWHVIPAMIAIDDNALVGAQTRVVQGEAVAVVLTVAITTLAGYGFCWLKLRADSLAAPILAHVSTNSVAFAMAWVVLH